MVYHGDESIRSKKHAYGLATKPETIECVVFEKSIDPTGHSSPLSWIYRRVFIGLLRFLLIFNKSIDSMFSTCNKIMLRRCRQLLSLRTLSIAVRWEIRHLYTVRLSLSRVLCFNEYTIYNQ